MNHVDTPHHSTYLGSGLARDTTGRGIMTDTTRYLVNELFHDRGFHQVLIAVHPRNHRSRRVAERLHFSLEGVMRDVFLYGDHYIDWPIYAVLEPNGNRYSK